MYGDAVSGWLAGFRNVGREESRRRTYLADIAVACVAFGLGVVIATQAPVDSSGLSATFLVTSAISCAVLVLRRRWPPLVLGFVAGWSCLVNLLAGPPGDGPSLLAAWVAFYSAGAYRPAKVAWTAAAGAVILILPAALARPDAVVQSVAGVLLWSVGSTFLGCRLRRGRAYVAKLEQRALRAERNHDERNHEQQARRGRARHDSVAAGVDTRWPAPRWASDENTVPLGVQWRRSQGSAVPQMIPVASASVGGRPTASGWRHAATSGHGTASRSATAVTSGNGTVSLSATAATAVAPFPAATGAATIPAGAHHRLHTLRPGRLHLGRSSDNDITVGDLLASRYHAALEVRADGVRIVDLGSANGTFVNGRRVTAAPVGERDVIAIGHHLYQLKGDCLVEYIDSGDVAFEARALSVHAGAKQLMHNVTFRLPARSLLAVVGPSGAGKSTLLNALAGFRPADAGTVRYAGRDLYADYEELRRRIGYVPQADPLHGQLTVRQALEYGAELRFPADTTAHERRTRVEEVLDELGLTAHADTAVHRLSGGQRKRTSVALELLTCPSLLFLDEPTSGLDPANDQSVMQTLRGLAKGAGASTDRGAGTGPSDENGRTVIVVTHSVLFLDLCDYVLVLAPGGHVAYFGPVDGALHFFGKNDFREFASVFRTLEHTSGAGAAARFRASEYFVPSAVVAPMARRPPADLPRVRKRPVVAQLSTLTRRYLRVIRADHSYLRLIIVFPFLLGFIPRMIPAPDGLGALPDAPNPNAPKVFVVLILCGCFMGMANSVREIVKERDIYRRERTIGLSRAAYLGSKTVVLTGITTVQCVVCTFIGLVGRAPADAVALGSPLAEILIAMIVTANASMVIGLLVSTIVDTADKTMPVLVLVTMAQLMLSGGLVSLSGRTWVAQISWIAPARWGYAALASTADINEVSKLGYEGLRTDPADPLWEHNQHIWTFDIGFGVILACATLALTAAMLRRVDPRLTRPTRSGPGVATSATR
ncbi:ABC-type multidrug transport system, ATPase component [Parafrankia irregularis]|uniref:ABC-type multidrug transport system, ATPase component n=1 Tax=Parafrankia irregularis TaxID=795642 RepID=A0A0S4QMX2_9ACTN|nr:ABC-type multidrug transport system, ATPase component [Parafrankia irregularis]